MDVVGAVVGLVVLSPLLLVIGVAVRVTSRGPVLFRQSRVGLGGTPFVILKFRSMTQGAEKMGPGITREKDPRITKIGVFLRKWKLDELPQLVNVLRGDMSIVGPRPELAQYVQHYTAQQRQVLSVRPGITDLASLRYRSEEALLQASNDPGRLYLEKIMPDKLTLNLQYIESLSFIGDLTLIVLTLKSLVIRSTSGTNYGCLPV